MVLSVLIAAASFADLTAARHPVTPTAIRIPMIAITIISSMREKPFCFRFFRRGGIIASSEPLHELFTQKFLIRSLLGRISYQPTSLLQDPSTREWCPLRQRLLSSGNPSCAGSHL